MGKVKWVLALALLAGCGGQDAEVKEVFQYQQEDNLAQLQIELDRLRAIDVDEFGLGELDKRSLLLTKRLKEAKSKVRAVWPRLYDTSLVSTEEHLADIDRIWGQIKAEEESLLEEIHEEVFGKSLIEEIKERVPDKWK